MAFEYIYKYNIKDEASKNPELNRFHDIMIKCYGPLCTSISDNSADSESADIFHNHLPQPNKDNIPDNTE